MKLDKSRAHVVEHGISPPMTNVITLPTGHHGVVVYVCLGPWAQGAPSERRARDKVVAEVVAALECRELAPAAPAAQFCPCDGESCAGYPCLSCSHPVGGCGCDRKPSRRLTDDNTIERHGDEEF